MKQISKASLFLLRYLVELYPLGVASTTPIHGARFDEQPKMVNMRGLVRRGWAIEATEGNDPFGRGLGIFYITERGRQALKSLGAEPLTKGDLVEMTPAGIKNGLDGRHQRRFGRVTTSEHDGQVHVRREGDKGNAGRYSVTYWKKVPKTA